MKNAPRRTALAVVAAAALMATGLVQADDVDHFEGKPSRTLTEAMENLETGNARLRTLLDGDLSPTEMAEVHEVTYTLENALARIDEARDDAATVLEEVHLASERNDTETVRVDGRSYLEATAGLTR
jgi:hypothetical protein